MVGIPLEIKEYCRIFKNSPGIMVVSNDLEEGRLIEVNEAFEKAFKCTSRLLKNSHRLLVW